MRIERLKQQTQMTKQVLDSAETQERSQVNERLNPLNDYLGHPRCYIQRHKDKHRSTTPQPQQHG